MVTYYKKPRVMKKPKELDSEQPLKKGGEGLLQEGMMNDSKKSRAAWRKDSKKS